MWAMELNFSTQLKEMPIIELKHETKPDKVNTKIKVTEMEVIFRAYQIWAKL